MGQGVKEITTKGSRHKAPAVSGTSSNIIMEVCVGLAPHNADHLLVMSYETLPMTTTNRDACGSFNVHPIAQRWVITDASSLTHKCCYVQHMPLAAIYYRHTCRCLNIIFVASGSSGLFDSGTPRGTNILLKFAFEVSLGFRASANANKKSCIKHHTRRHRA